MSGWTFEWSHGHGSVQELGGMLGPVHFRLPDDRLVQPFALFPWVNEKAPPGEGPLTGLMASSSGEWPCVPFGITNENSAWHPPIHGEPAHGNWKRVDDGGDPARLSLRFSCGAAGPVEALEREIEGVRGEAAIRCRLTLHVRRPCLLPIGLHPTLRVPLARRGMTLTPGQFEFGMTYPLEVEPGADVLESGVFFPDLSSVPARNGGEIDLTAYPLHEATESLVQLCGVDGRMELTNHEEGYHVSVTWPPSKLPSCVLWISNGGRCAWPWSGRHFALGVEPVCSAFDLGVAASNGLNPISERGIPTTMALHPDAATTIEYRISVADAASTVRI
ncbi:hypothetical protein [Burkholderia pseudomallei]|uniref:hypothetical protein n=1 Tax=Burkholderia pseudomallei TaxID=28450 RepID=UPI001A9E8BAF|nr:hypothetical protein [Burkholderia pseudomallei]QTB53394.1 hypothetical protein J3C54_31085 [Burkholderia pseudomallei]